eukprot:TRINITY_DN926_c0_g1_i1.p2 TRINITY_DN926_c0_g1~~TRINITY_DN926_c0_g1_i1.p2  ORF type:complete len:113 (-),score=13.15 TRINITY_DN926_c0_g1_i1:217-555(-)
MGQIQMLQGKQLNLVSRRQSLIGSGFLCGQLIHFKAHAKNEIVVNKEVDNQKSPLVQKLLQKSTELKEQRKQERLQEYYQRNFSDYFEFEMGNRQSEETRKRISEWLEKNKK